MLGELFKKLLEGSAPTAAGRYRQSLRGLATRLIWSQQLNKLNDTERLLVEDFSRLVRRPTNRRTRRQPLMDDRRTFHIACQISHALGYGFFCRFVDFVRQGQLMESLQTVASLGPVALSMAPYLAAFSTQHKDEPFLRAVAAHFPAAAASAQASRPQGVDHRHLCRSQRRQPHDPVPGRHRHENRPAADRAHVPAERAADQGRREELPARGHVSHAGIRIATVSFPPFLEVIEYIERHRFNELIISTPGPMGLTGLAAARLLGLRTTGIYHTDFAQYVRHLTQDDDLADLTWKYMLWFYEQTDTILVPTEYYRKQLMRPWLRSDEVGRHGPRRRHANCSIRDKRDPALFDRYGLNGDRSSFSTSAACRGRRTWTGCWTRSTTAWPRAQRISLVVVGDGPYREELQTRCQGRPVVFTGLLEGEELAAAYASADAMVFPSTTDTFGNVVLEAQASGVPVIVTDLGGPAEIVA